MASCGQTKGEEGVFPFWSFVETLQGLRKSLLIILRAVEKKLFQLALHGKTAVERKLGEEKEKRDT